MRVRAWVATAVIAFAVTVGLPTGFSVWFVRNQVQHSCSALQLLTARPVPAPGRDAGPSRVTLYRFYRDLVYWRNADGCGT